MFDDPILYWHGPPKRELKETSKCQSGGWWMSSLSSQKFLNVVLLCVDVIVILYLRTFVTPLVHWNFMHSGQAFPSFSKEGDNRPLFVLFRVKVAPNLHRKFREKITTMSWTILHHTAPYIVIAGGRIIWIQLSVVVDRVDVALVRPHRVHEINSKHT